MEEVLYGMGLSINKKVAEGLGGSISVVSKESNNTVFSFSFEAKCTDTTNIDLVRRSRLSLTLFLDDNSNFVKP